MKCMYCAKETNNIVNCKPIAIPVCKECENIDKAQKRIWKEKVPNQMINKKDIVYFDEKDFVGLGKELFFVEGRSLKDVRLPNADAKILFVRVVCSKNETLDKIRVLGDSLSKKFPTAEIKWALGIGKNEKLQILGMCGYGKM